jgi:hypothetical protein
MPKMRTWADLSLRELQALAALRNCPWAHDRKKAARAQQEIDRRNR